MGQVLHAETIGDEGKAVDTADDQHAPDRVIAKLVTENAQLRELVIQLTRIAIRNVTDRK